MLSAIFCSIGNPHIKEAFHVVELGRARALADLMSAQYFTEKHIPINLQSVVDIESTMEKETNCTCLYISYFVQFIYLWILKADKPIAFRKIDATDCVFNKGDIAGINLADMFKNETTRRFHNLQLEDCEDRSLFPAVDQIAATRLGEIEQEEDQNRQADLSLKECYQMLIDPVADLLDGQEIIIVPDRSLYKVPFAALSDENGKPLSETLWIRIVRSLTTLKLIQNSPSDYHSQTGALIVGEPEVSEVSYKGSAHTLCPLPSARKEAEMISRLLGTQPLLGQQATKQAVLQSIHSVALIHFAAHGSAERGEIALSPLPSISGIQQEEDYLLTMADIAKVRLRAKLVVLSCCHSARGQIMSKGVVGIAQAFLGSGARSVLVSLWAIDDKATEQFMGRFYEHLVHGESASESLHQAMKSMRGNGFTDGGPVGAFYADWR